MMRCYYTFKLLIRKNSKPGIIALTIITLTTHTIATLTTIALIIIALTIITFTTLTIATLTIATLTLTIAALTIITLTIITLTIIITITSKNFSIDKSAVLRLKAETLLNKLNDPLNASKLFNESVTTNPCELDVYRLYITSLKEAELDGHHVDWLSTMKALIELSNELLDEEYKLDDVCLKDGALVSSLDFFELKKTSSSSSSSSLEFANTADMARSGIYWAIYEAADQANDTTNAWEYLQVARSLDLETYGELSNYDLEKTKSDAKAITTLFNKDHWPDASYSIGSTSKIPVFIIGFLRSGMTLLQSLLVSQPNITSISNNDILIKEIITMQEDMAKSSKSFDRKNKDDVKKMMASRYYYYYYYYYY